MTKALRELEGEQHLALAVRAVSGITFTDYGKALLTHARLIVGQLGRAEAELAQFRGAGTVRLCVGVTPWVITSDLLPEVVQRFRERMPNVQLEIFEGLMGISQMRLREGEMDLAITPHLHGLVSPEFSSEVLLSYGMRVVVWRGHPLQDCTTIHELLENDWAVNYAADGRDTFMHNLFWQHGARIDESRMVRAHSLSLMQALLQHAGMISFCPLPMLTSAPMKDDMVALPLKEQFEPATLAIITRRGGTISNAAQCFIDCLINVIYRHSRSSTKKDRLLFDALELRM